jgi:hypothetical protein
VPLVRADIEDDSSAGVGACSLAAVNKVGRSDEAAGSLENGLDASFAGTACVVVSLDGSAEGVTCDLKPEKDGAVLKALLALFVSG